MSKKRPPTSRAERRRRLRAAKKTSLQPAAGGVLSGAAHGATRLQSRAAPAQPIGQAALTALALCLAVAISYFPATGADFVWDDVVLTKARSIHDWSGLWQLWFEPRLLTDYEGHYWPLLYTTFWLEHKIWGLNPLGYHLINMTLHAGVVVLVWQLLRRLGVPGAVFAAALFAVHPQHVESVVWIIGRKDVLATLFFLAAVFTYVRFIEQGRRAQYVCSLALFVLGLLSKSILITLPAVLMIWHWWRQGRVTAATMATIWPFFAIGIAITLADVAFYKGRDPTAFDFSALERVLLAARTLGFYVGKLLWPMDLAVVYHRWQVGLADGLAWGCAFGAAAVLAGLWFYRERIGRGPLAGALFFVVTLSPNLGFVDYGYMLYSFVADRYQYLPGLGLMATLAAIAAAGVTRAAAALPPSPALALRFGAAGLAGLILLGLATLTWRQASIYQDEFTFYSHIIGMNPQARFIHRSLGMQYHDRGRYEDALAAYRMDLKLAQTQPSPHLRIANNHSSIGRSLEELGRLDEAEQSFRAGLAQAPTHAAAADDLGGFLIRRQRYREALHYFQALVGNKPRIPRYHVGHGVALAGLGRADQALQAYDRALALAPGMPMARDNRAALLKSRGAQPAQ